METGYKTSQIATNQKEVEFALFHCCIGHYLRVNWAGLELFGREIEVFVSHVCRTFTINLRQKTVSHCTSLEVRFDKFHHNKRITLKLQRCILESFAYLCSFSWVPDPNLCQPPFDDKIALSRGGAE